MNGKLIRRVFHLLLPTSCALCGAGSDDTLCATCVHQFFGTAAAVPRCPCCANPVAAGATLCGHCIAARPAFDRTVVACDYALPVDQLVLQLKFGHRLALAALMARRLAVVTAAAAAESPGALPDLLCPVPLGPRRLAQRGYNQALEIARPLARCLGVALQARLVARTRETAAQSSVAPEDRRANIAGAFAVPAPALALVRGRHIGVVDDVMTSGSTLDEMAATLKRHGAARVSNLVFARTPPH
ncbi:UNVERIFIED_ORG: ComF family protein [Zoogloea ramigera]|uniref:ComF family protein n=1 Tax=Duganella zoogloeoides TaxID=75659 RepID=A0ABZ0XVM5_9BURK|nr:ComF family protein [Duganella zoogloeoides]WQH03714.1 ComF family protein [Duganella zoogloeoides]